MQSERSNVALEYGTPLITKSMFHIFINMVLRETGLIPDSRSLKLYPQCGGSSRTYMSHIQNEVLFETLHSPLDILASKVKCCWSRFCVCCMCSGGHRGQSCAVSEPH